MAGLFYANSEQKPVQSRLSFRDMFSLLFTSGVIGCCKGKKFGYFVFKVVRKCITELKML